MYLFAAIQEKALTMPEATTFPAIKKSGIITMEYIFYASRKPV
jgi:hypothetical protein